MIVEEVIFISEVEISYLLLSTSECSLPFIDCNRQVSTEGIYKYVKMICKNVEHGLA